MQYRRFSTCVVPALLVQWFFPVVHYFAVRACAVLSVVRSFSLLHYVVCSFFLCFCFFLSFVLALFISLSLSFFFWFFQSLFVLFAVSLVFAG